MKLTNILLYGVWSNNYAAYPLIPSKYPHTGNLINTTIENSLRRGKPVYFLTYEEYQEFLNE